MRRNGARRGALSGIVEDDPVNRRILATLSYGHLATDLPQGAIPALLPLFRSEYHLSYTQLGLIVLLANVSSSVIQPLFGVLSDRMKMYWLMPAGTLVASAGMLLAVAAARQYPTVVAMIFLSGLGVAAFHPEGYKYAGLASGAGRACLISPSAATSATASDRWRPPSRSHRGASTGSPTASRSPSPRRS